MVTLLRKYWSVILLIGHRIFFVLGAYVALAASGADRTMGSCDMSIHHLSFSSPLWVGKPQTRVI